mmetsp:Transcript_82026/g.240802  ORF Transcript_82026/g.240802 Transcript_82026/m.240802 type:complete len:1231 (+) Transcript_82026:2-3694(+)
MAAGEAQTRDDAAPEGRLSRAPLLSLFRRPRSAQLVQLFRPDESRSNRIRTNKYTWYNFIPCNLFEQFRQLGNAYFLLVALLQMVPAISNTGGRPLTLIPLCFVVLLGAAKDAFEDMQRYLSDRRENMGDAVIVDEELHETWVRWQDIRPGMVLLLQEGERLPVDALVLATDLPDGECYVETSNLDGESNLKKKVAAMTRNEWRELCRRSGQEGPACMTMEVEPPSVDLYQFNGAIQMFAETEMQGVNIGNLLLRGTSLQRTGRVYCLAVYCGGDTRAIQNSQSARFKASKLDVELNRVVLMIFAMQFVICVVLSSCSMVWQGQGAWYLSGSARFSLLVALRRAGTWLLQTNSMVPVSLIVTLTGVKFAQGMFLAWDRGCGDVDHGKAAKVNTSQVLESLGQVTHVFSDKTGTLTQNVMEYKACSVAGRIYGLEEEPPRSDPSAGGPQLWSLQERAEEGMAGSLSSDTQQALVKFPHVCFRADAFHRDLGAAEDVGRPAALALFLMCQAVCHSVEVEGSEGARTRGSRGSVLGTAPLYNGSSPDELALVYMAHAMGLEFVGMAEGTARLRVRGATLAAALEAACGGPSKPGDGANSTSLAVDILDICDFDNDRKRSSCVVRFPDGRLELLLKGADSSVLPHVGSGVSLCEEHLSAFAQRGLRTLCLASRTLSKEHYDAWHARYAQAQSLISDKAQQVARLAEELETGGPLQLLGATAIEDRLQDQVPETIEQLRLAGICVWVLTGDKVETAISIARSCRLLTEDMENILIEDTSPAAVEEELNRAMQCERPAITVAGAALTTALATEESQRRFLEVAVRCRSVVCCRVSPKQKADVVKLVKDHKADSTTLSIGDGANDVSMIVTAHVGVGLSGKEGAQAAYTADFAISEFRFLRRLIFVHGRESYRRTSVVIFYNFYKNILLVAPTILFAPLSGFTGQNVFFPWLCQLYNVFYTHFAACVYGVCDRAVEDLDDLEVEPSGHAQRLFSPPRAAAWILAGFLQAAVINAVAGNGLDGGMAGEDGQGVADLTTTGYVRFVWVVLIANIIMALRQSCWICFMWPVYAVNVGSALASVWVFGRNSIQQLLGDNLPRVLLATVLVVVTCVIIGEFIIRNTGVFEAMLCGRKSEVDAEASAFGAAPRASAREVQPQRSSEVELVSCTSSGMSAEAPEGGARASQVSERRSERRTSLVGSSVQRLGSFGYAFSQECALERASFTSRNSLSQCREHELA